jgi:hypothetical protein
MYTGSGCQAIKTQKEGVRVDAWLSLQVYFEMDFPLQVLNEWLYVNSFFCILSEFKEHKLPLEVISPIWSSDTVHMYATWYGWVCCTAVLSSQPMFCVHDQ